MIKFRCIFVVTLSLLLGIMGCSGSTDTVNFKDGVYTGTGTGYGGEMEVQVTVSGGRITEIEILREQETPGISDDAKVKIPERIISDQTTDIEMVTGATATSRGIRDAVQDALEGAHNN